ncbi:unnamed protein product [Scytosiphon promiscuus]
MIRSFVSLAFLAGCVTAHPQCFINDRPPDTDKTSNIWCPNEQYNGDAFIQAGACCTDVEEETIESLYSTVSAGLTSTCADLYVQVLCGQCHSYSAHLFENLGADFGPYDGLTMTREFCEAFVDACGDQLTLGGPDEYDGLDYCDHHVGGIDGEDELWSYPYTDPLPADGGLALLFPNIDASSDFPEWQLSMRQTPDADMWWIVGQQGQISGVKTSDMDTAFDVLDIENQPDFLQSWPEEGLFDVAFDPGWTSNSFFYVSYTIDSGTVDEDGTSLAQNRLSRFTYAEGDPVTTRDSEVVLLDTATKLSTIHSAGWVGFKPSAYDTPISGWNDLYWSVGDGGPAGDTSNSGQNMSNLLGNMIRISVPSSTTETTTYEIPSGNYQDVDSTAAPEVCAPGLRNPWRCSFDKLTEDLWCADVGQGDYEEINIVECGKNYGWPRFEGSGCQQLAIDEGLYPSCDDSVRSQYEFPIYEYCHLTSESDPDLTNGVDVCGDREITGNAIIGGFVYRGTYFDEVLYGAYVFADHQTRFVNFIKQNEEGVWVSGSIISDAADIFISFAEDIDGELYLIDRVREIFYLPCGDMCSTTCLVQNEEQPSIESQGCYSDSATDRALTLDTATTCSSGETYMSPLICASYCSTITGAVYSGVSAGTDCYCGSSTDNFSNNGELDEENCATLCDSNPEETCGGVDAIEVFVIGPAITPPPSPAPISVGGSTPSPVAVTPAPVTPAPVDGSTPAPVDDETPAPVDIETPAPVDVETPAPVQDSTPAPAADGTCVNGLPGIDGSNERGDVCCPLACGLCGGIGCSTGLDNEECCINGVLGSQPDCADSGAAPCIVSSVSAPTPAPAAVAEPTPAPAAVVEPTPAPAAVTEPTPAPAPVTAPTPSAAGYLGCFEDGKTPPPSPVDDEFRMFELRASVSTTSMTAEYCKGICEAEAGDYDYYGTQFSRECWCGAGTPADTYLRYGTALDESSCDMACTGDETEMCGGFTIMSVYSFDSA